MIARLASSRRAIRRARRSVPLAHRVAAEAERMQAELGISALAALAAAEAVELMVDHDGLRLEEIGFDRDMLLWHATYETGPQLRPVFVRMPLEHATEATQRGIGGLN